MRSGVGKGLAAEAQRSFTAVGRPLLIEAGFTATKPGRYVRPVGAVVHRVELYFLPWGGDDRYFNIEWAVGVPGALELLYERPEGDDGPMTLAFGITGDLDDELRAASLVMRAGDDVGPLIDRHVRGAVGFLDTLRSRRDLSDLIERSGVERDRRLTGPGSPTKILEARAVLAALERDPGACELVDQWEASLAELYRRRTDRSAVKHLQKSLVLVGRLRAAVADLCRG